jgi:AcrR family transcriptional regulator
VASSSLREHVLRASVDFIAENGPDRLSFRQVAATAGVSHQAPYHHFADRKAIFRAIALEGFTMFRDELRAALAQPDGSLAMLEAYVEFALANRGHYRVMFRRDLCDVLFDTELKTAADDSFDVLVDQVRADLSDDPSIDDIRARATAMWSLAHGLADLLIDGPLEGKIGTIEDRRTFIRAVALQSKKA